MNDFIRITFSTAEQLALALRRESGVLNDLLDQFHHSASNLYASGLQGTFADSLLGRIENTQRILREISAESDEAGRDLATVVERWRQLDAESASKFAAASRLEAFHGFSGGGGGGGASGGWGGNTATGFDMKTFPYHLMSGREYREHLGIHSGEMSEEDIERILREDPFANKLTDYIDAEVTLLNEERAGEFALWAGETSSDFGATRLSLGEIEASESYSVSFDKDGLNAKVDYEVGAYLAKVEANADLAGARASAEGYIGANIQTGAGAVLDPITGDAKLEAKLDAFAGGRVQGEVETNLSALGVESVDVGVQGALSYGLGVKLDADIGVESGILTANFDLGATLGLGAEFGFTVSVDANQVGQDIAGIGQSILDIAGIPSSN